MDGVKGVTSIIEINKYVSVVDQSNLWSLCSSFYGPPNTYEPGEAYTINVEKIIDIPLNITRLQ